MRRSAGLLLVLLAAAGCGGPDPTPEPTDGELVLQLTSPNSTDGALLVRVVGPLTGVTAAGSYRVSYATQGNITRVVVTGDITSGSLVRIKVPDVSQSASYSAIVEQAASRENYALFSTSGYELSIRRP